MVKRSKGYRSRTRRKLSKHVREKGPSPVSRVTQNFSEGTKVAIIIDPSVVKGQPHPRYHGRIGTVKEKRGRAYLIEIKDGGTVKKLISGPEHLRKVEA